MTAKTSKLISPERVKKLFECYGSSPDAWPSDEKVSALSLIQHSSELRELQQETVKFDQILRESDIALQLGETADQELVNSIVKILPDQDSKPDSRFRNKISQDKSSLFDLNRMIGALAASVAIMAITLSIVTLKPENVESVSTVATANTELDNWMWEQVVGEPADDGEEALTMMALLEMEEI